jgi:drug/metabolite transporter (DMT)-like permease
LGIALGLTAAVCWGLADYFAALSSRAIGTLRVVLAFHVAATALLAALVVATGALDGVTWGDAAPFLAVGAVGWLSYLAFYRALAIGPISIASPIVSGYAAVTVVLAVIVIGERLSALAVVAVCLAFAGVAIASIDPRSALTGGISGLGVLFSLLAMVLIGAFVFGVAYYRDELGWLVPIFLGRGVAPVFLLGNAAANGDWRFPRVAPRVAAAVLFIAFVDTAGYASFNLGTEHADTAVVATASAPYSTIPIVAGVVLLGERPVPSQWVGIALVIAGLVLLGLAS